MAETSLNILETYSYARGHFKVRLRYLEKHLHQLSGRRDLNHR